LISGISGAVPEFSEINLEIVPKIRKSVACAGPEISLFSVILGDFGNLSLISLYWDGKKDEYKSCLTDFSLEGIMHCKQWTRLQALSNKKMLYFPYFPISQK
jgi:hypothetical protein